MSPPRSAARVLKIGVTENTYVRKGDLLFQIGPVPYEASVRQSEADLALARANLDNLRRAISTQRSAATVASDQISRAVARQRPSGA